MKSKKTAIIIQFLFVCALALFIARQPILLGIGAFLTHEDALQKSDCIIVLGGSHERVKEAAKLYHEGWAPYLIMTGKSRTKFNLAENMRHNAMHLEVPADRIIVESQAESTYQHPIYVKPIIEEKGFDSAIIVSTSYHMRRSKMLFDRAFQDRNVTLTYYPVQKSWFDPKRWWTHKHSRKAVVQEYAKLAVNFFGNDFTRFVQKLVDRKG